MWLNRRPNAETLCVEVETDREVGMLAGRGRNVREEERAELSFGALGFEMQWGSRYAGGVMVY